MDIVLIHGFRGTHHGLNLIAKNLPKEANIFIPDLPGFGDGEILSDYSIKGYIEWLKKYIKNLNLEDKPILLGHSFGSIITSHFAQKNPEMISKLILVNPIAKPALSGSDRFLTNLAISYYKIGSILPENFARKWLGMQLSTDITSLVMTKTKDKKIKKFIIDQHRKYFSNFQNPKTLLDIFITSTKNCVGDVSKEITTPTLLIGGGKDQLVPVKDIKNLNQDIKNSELVIIEDVGHLTHYETPEEVADSIQKFIKK